MVDLQKLGTGALGCKLRPIHLVNMFEMRFDAAHVAGTKCPISSFKKSLQATPASVSKAAARNLSLRSSTTIPQII